MKYRLLCARNWFHTYFHCFCFIELLNYSNTPTIKSTFIELGP